MVVHSPDFFLCLIYPRLGAKEADNPEIGEGTYIKVP